MWVAGRASRRVSSWSAASRSSAWIRTSTCSPARAPIPRAPLVCARAEALPFGPAAFALALCGQAFHWLETSSAIRELGRVVRPRGWSVAFWNERRPEGLAGDYDRILRAHSNEYVGITRDAAMFDGYRQALAGQELKEVRLPNSQTFDLAGFLGRARSASYFAHGVADKPALTRDLAQAFARREENGVGVFAYDTVALMWRPSR